jgi:ribosomal protein S12 methylthiotransferase
MKRMKLVRSKTSKKVYPVSLGCPKNKSDFEKLLFLLNQKGYEFTLDPGEADLFWVNTCAFIQPAVNEALEHIFELGELKTPHQKLIVSGCLPARYAVEDLKKLLPEVDEFYGIEPFRYFAKEEPSDKVLSESPFYSYLKISEGCSHRCSYCTIPKIRGPFRSKPLELVLKEAENLLKKGVRELIIVGQDITLYGRDLKESNLLIKLLKKISSLPFHFRIRLLYLHPLHLSDELIEAIFEIPKVVPYFEIPIQHADSEILKKMHRGYTPERILKIIEKVRSFNSMATLRTSIIVGFPGEKEKHFLNLITFLKEAQFDYLGVFPFYPEEGTPAEALPEQVPSKEKKRRVKEVLKVQKEITKKRLNLRVGQRDEVLILGEDIKGRLFGLSTLQAPEIDGLTFLKRGINNLLPGNLVKVKILKSGAYDLWAEPLDLRG